MRPQAAPLQEPGEQKKSVFDRLGRQLDTRRSINRGSPVHYGDHPMHQVMHEADFARFGRAEQHPDMSWRYQNDRRHMPFGRERHQPPVGQFGPQFDINMPQGRQPLQYFPHPHPHQPQYHGSPGGPTLMGPEVLSIGMDQRRHSPKYDRHGNPIRGPIRIDHPPGMSPPANFMGPPPPGPMIHPSGYEMIPMNPGMYQQNRWHETLDMGPPMHGRVVQDERFIDSQRFQQQQQPKVPMMINPDQSVHQSNFEAPRYSKWRERRDVITNLDRQTAQSSSKTDSLKSSLQQADARAQFKKGSKDNRQAKVEFSGKQAVSKKETNTSASTAAKSKQSATLKTEPSEISDGEIIDDEDSSDESDNQKVLQGKETLDRPNETSTMIRKTPYGRAVVDGEQYFDVKKRRRLDRDDYPMDYETISDEELDDFMNDKKLVEDEKLDESSEGKSSSEIELLNALGLDWAHLVELSKQSKKEASASGSAMRRFSIPNYLPTLGITRELAGPDIHNLILKVCHC